MKAEFVLGLDGGTGGMRAMAFDREGRIAGTGSAAYRTDYPAAGQAQQEPEEWLAAAVGSVRAASDGLRGSIAALCAATTSCTVVCCTRGGRALAPAILWMDVRAGDQMRAIREKTGQELSAETFLCKALWLRENDPALWARTEVLCEYQDYLNHWLTGEWCFSVNTACNWGYNARKGCFPLSFMEEIGLSELLEKIPRRAVKVGDTVGNLKQEAAELLGLDAGIPVIQGGIDSSVGMLGMGTVRPGALSLMTGSSNLAMAVTEKPLFVPENAVNSGPDFLLPGYYTSVQGQAATGSLLRWFRRELCRDLGQGAYSVLDPAAASVPAGSGGVLVLDYWQGNRCPHNDPDATGVIFGLTMNTTREQIFRAVMEAVAYGTLDVLGAFARNGLAADSVNISGGNTRSPVFLQIYADVCGIPFRVTSDHSVALGGAILAAFACGWYASIPEAADSMVHYSETYMPDEGRHRVYENEFKRYKALYSALKQNSFFNGGK